MKNKLLALALLSAGLANAQADRWSEILQTDPYLSNGYFIVNQAKYHAMGIDSMNVQIIVATPHANAPATKQTVQSFGITNGKYGHADMGFLQSMQPNQTSYYHITGYTPTGSTPIDIDAECVGCQSWPEVCRQTCLSNDYSWAIKAYAYNGQAVMEMTDGTINGSYDYFYVQQSDWANFTLTHSLSQLGLLDANDWNDYFIPGYPSQEVFEEFPVPPEARQMNGALVPDHDHPVYAIAKHKWPWSPVLETNTLIDNTSSWCSTATGLQDHFNGDGHVQYTLAQNSLLPVTCANIAFSGGAGVEWGGVFTECTALTVYSNVYTDGTVDILGWMISTTTCAVSPTSLYPYTFEDISSLIVTPIGGTTNTPVLQVNIDGVTDPRLVRVPKTTIGPGLYEFKVILNNGQVLRHYEDFTAPLVVNSRFASFVDENIYPVPVVGNRFAVDMDLLYPMHINISVVDNNGNTKYTASWNFTQAGRNKQVIEMDPLWNNGIYHAIFQFPDGSSESKNFNIAH